MSKLLFSMALAAMATSALATPAGYKMVVARQNAQGDYSNITMGRATLNWGSANPPDVLGQALNQQCGPGTQCDQNQWTQVATVCSDNSDGTTCQQENINIVCDGQWPDDNMRQALIQGLQAAIGQGSQTADVTIAGTGGGPYSAYYPGSEFTAYQQASFVGITVYHNDESLVAQISATITLSQIDDNWCGSAATSLFGAGGSIASAVGQGELATVFGFLSSICGSGT